MLTAYNTQTILITGGTGFLGKRLGKKLKNLGHDVILAGRDPHRLLLAQKFSGCKTLDADIRNLDAVKNMISQVKPSLIIHGAAAKSGDFSEKKPMEAIDINVVGSQNVARVAIEQNVDLVIGLSTVKAASPQNTYGITKSLMERLFTALDGKNKTRFISLRIGNILWSTGSVLCIWRKMLEQNKLIETTGPQMLRFFLTADEAIELIQNTVTHANELYGKVIGRYMKSAMMEDILKVWIKQERVAYKTIEPRFSEQPVEYLIGEQELLYTTQKMINNILHYIISFNQPVKDPLMQVISSSNTTRLDEDEIKHLINNPPEEEIYQSCEVTAVSKNC